MILEDELKIIETFQRGNALDLDGNRRYSDEFYKAVINTIQAQAGRKNALFLFALKRLFDILFSSILILLTAIPFLVIAIIIKYDSKGPAIFKNRRIGKNGKEFNCLKFRSMLVSAPSEVATSTGGMDCYVTKIGKFLRKTSLDELPQIYNVFIGQMSFIGYRPLVPSEEKCNLMRKQLGVFKMRPGISGYSQVHGRDDVYYKNKALMDAYYVKHFSIMMDIRIILSSIKVVLKKDGNNDAA